MKTDPAQPRRTDLPDMSADLIAGRRFGQTWRGYDTEEVKQFLLQVAAQVNSLKERCDSADAARRDAEQRASHPQLDEATVMSVVGEETAGILRSARSAAAEITAKAEAISQAIVAAARAKASELTAQSESLLATRTSEAEAAADEVRSNASADAERIRTLAEQQASSIEQETTRRCQEAVREAEALREKVLSDLARRRKLATVELEQLRAGRERLLDAYLVVRRTLDEVTDELQRADAEPRAGTGAVAHPGGDEALPAEHPRGPTGPVVLAPLAIEMAARPVRPTAGKATPDHPAQDRDITTTIVTASDAVESVRILPQPPSATSSSTPPPAEAPPAEAPPAEAPPAEAPPAEALGPGQHLVGAEHRGSEVENDVQGLFARIRAGRAEATSAAMKALHDGDATQDRKPGPSDVATILPQALPGEPREPSGTGSLRKVPRPPEDSTTKDRSSLQHDFFERRNEVTGRLGSSLARKLKRALQDEQNSLLDRLRSLKGPVTPASVLPNIEEQPDRFMDAGRPLLEDAARAGSQSISAFYATDAVPDRLAQGPLGPGSIEDLVEELGRSITEPLRQRLELAFQSASDNPTDVANALGSAYREWKTQRIEATANDQVSAAFSRGAYLAFPDDAMLRWVVDASEVPCPDCEDNTLAGAQPKAESWPTGQLHPPAHPGCRCALVPVHGERPTTAPSGAPGTPAS